MKRFLSTVGALRLNRGPKPTATLPFQILSDLHLELGQQYSFDFPATAPNLILAGDIGLLSNYSAYLGFLHRQTARYRRVFLVLGNHEFYGLDFATALSITKQLEKEPCLDNKLTFLQQTRVDLPGSVSILGCTLWSHIPDEAKEIVKSKLNDFRRIERWTVESHNNAHAADVKWLRTELDNIDTDRSVLVVTHHAPLVLGTTWPAHLKNSWSCAFTTNVLSSEKTWDSVKYWVYGHTHYCAEFENRGVRLVSNQRGYVLPGGGSKRVDEAFDSGKNIRVPVGHSEEVG